jgi:AmmeMemoRadiSam system protein A
MDDFKTTALKIARDAIAAKLEGRPMPELGKLEGRLAEESGAFVTLRKKDGSLRGCIGMFFADTDLAHTIQEMAVSAAFGDSRFRPLRPEELQNIRIEISVLSPMKRIKDPCAEITLGTHGVYIKKGWRSGTYLPEVATDFNMTLDEFMSSLCESKAGLPAYAWKNDPEVEIYTYTTEHFEE